MKYAQNLEIDPLAAKEVVRVSELSKTFAAAMAIAKALPEYNLQITNLLHSDYDVELQLTISRVVDPNYKTAEIAKLQTQLFPGSRRPVVGYDEETSAITYTVGGGNPYLHSNFAGKLSQIAANLDKKTGLFGNFAYAVIPANLVILPSHTDYSKKAVKFAADLANAFNDENHGEFFEVTIDKHTRATIISIRCPIADKSAIAVVNFCKDLSQTFRKSLVTFTTYKNQVLGQLDIPTAQLEAALKLLSKTAQAKKDNLSVGYQEFCVSADTTSLDDITKPKELPRSDAMLKLLNSCAQAPGQREMKAGGRE